MPGVIIGVQDLHFAILTKDDSTGATYQAAEKIADAINIKVDPKTDIAKLYADNRLAHTATTLGEIDVEINVADLGLALTAKLLGGTLSNGELLNNADDEAPELAIGFRAPKSGGGYRYVWLFKGKFVQSAEEFATKEDKAKFQTPTIKGTFGPRAYDRNWRRLGDDDEVDFTGGATWFDSVDRPVAA